MPFIEMYYNVSKIFIPYPIYLFLFCEIKGCRQLIHFTLCWEK